MANESYSLIDILRELKSVALKKSSGFFFIATTDNHSCTIRMHGGLIEDVVYRRSRGDDAVHLLSHAPGGRSRFQPDPGMTSVGRSTLSQTAQRWLLGGFEAGPLPEEDAPSAAAPPPAASGVITPGQKQVIERVALNYLGPIASIICDEAFEASSEVDVILDLIGGNLASADEKTRFKREARAALG